MQMSKLNTSSLPSDGKEEQTENSNEVEDDDSSTNVEDDSSTKVEENISTEQTETSNEEDANQIQHKLPFLRAAVYVDQAFSSSRVNFDLSERPCALELNWILHNTTILKQIVIFGLLLLPFFEVPSWCYADGNCGEANVTLTSGLPVLDRQSGLGIELCILILLATFEVMNFWRTSLSSWKESPTDLTTIFLLFISIIDVFFTFGFPRNWRISPFCRPLLFVSLTMSIRECIYGILMGFKSIIQIIILEAFWIFFMSWFAVILFSNIPNYFNTLPEALMNMIILLTTANFPDVAVPAIQSNRGYILFFGLFLIVGLWFLMNMVLATIYSSYRRWTERLDTLYTEKKELCLKKAFKEIDMIRQSGSLDFKEVHELFKELNWYVHIPYIKTEQAELLFQSLDLANNGTIFENEFLRLGDVLDLEFRITTDHKTFLQRLFPGLTNSKSYKSYVAAIQNVIFDYFIDFCIIVNLILTGCEIWLPVDPFWSGYEYIFTYLFFIEMILKIIAAGGLREYWKNDKNKFDGLITLASVLVETIVLVPNDFNKKEVTRFILMFRVARLLRLFISFENYRILAATYISLLPVFIQLSGVLLVVYYLFCFVGIASFGGKIYVGAPNLNGTGFEAGNYMMLNFNDFCSGMMTLFSLMVVNNWFVIMDGFVSVTAQGAQVYFIAFWIVAVVTILSVVVASVLDRFNTEMEIRVEKRDTIDPVLLDGIHELGRKREDGVVVTVKRRESLFFFKQSERNKGK